MAGGSWGTVLKGYNIRRLRTSWYQEFQDNQGYTERPCLKKKRKKAGQQWGTPLIPALWSGDRARLISVFEASLIYREITRTARAMHRNSVSQKAKTNQPNIKNKLSLDFILDCDENCFGNLALAFVWFTPVGLWLLILLYPEVFWVHILISAYAECLHIQNTIKANSHYHLYLTSAFLN